MCNVLWQLQVHFKSSFWTVYCKHIDPPGGIFIPIVLELKQHVPDTFKKQTTSLLPGELVLDKA